MFHNWGVPAVTITHPAHLMLFGFKKKVATLAGAELITVTNTLESNEHQVKVASDWSIAMDLTLTELKVGNSFRCSLWCCRVFVVFENVSNVSELSEY